jgi:DNA polymerase bacteriophage-type
MRIYIDLETYSDIDIKKTGVYPYVESPNFEILLVGYAIDDGPVKVLTPSDVAMLGDFLRLCRSGDYELIAHNATFERLALKREGWNFPEWTCTAVRAAYCGLPSSLEEAGRAAGLPIQKDAAGKALIRYFSMPCKPTKTNGGRERNLPEHDSEKWQAFKDYLVKDVETTRELYKYLQGFEFTEQENYLIDQKINDRGVRIDADLVRNAVELDRLSTHKLTVEARKLTGLDNPNSPSQLASWLSHHTGDDITSLRKDDVKEMLASAEGDVKRALELRQMTSNTSVKKYQAAQSYLCKDGRARGLFQFYGASRTGRWAGRGIQLQNLPRNYMSTLEEARELVKQGDFETLDFLYESPQQVLKELTRTMIIPTPCNRLLIADFSAIEARALAWLAGEKWRLEVFRTHGKIYEASASAMFGVPLESIDKSSPYRQKGKIAELALGYQGGVGALKTMGGEAMGLSESEMSLIVTRWRKANPAIKRYWSGVEESAKLAVRNPNKKIPYKNLIFEFRLSGKEGALVITLPSKRILVYQKASLAPSRFGGEVVKYWGVDQTTRRWVLLDTYGGKLVENIVQAVARDLLAVTIRRAVVLGIDVIAHVHDEVIAEAPESLTDKAYSKLVELMSDPPDWAKGLPLGADGFTAKFYQKD